MAIAVLGVEVLVGVAVALKIGVGKLVKRGRLCRIGSLLRLVKVLGCFRRIIKHPTTKLLSQTKMQNHHCLLALC